MFMGGTQLREKKVLKSVSYFLIEYQAATTRLIGKIKIQLSSRGVWSFLINHLTVYV